MIKIKWVLYFLLIFAINSGSYNYYDQGKDWHRVNENCNGSRQSPIDFNFNPPLNCSARAIKLELNPNKIETTIDQAHSFKTEGEFGRVFLTSGTDVLEYKALQFHIHAPSEHTVNGKFYDAEIHLVFQIVGHENHKTSNSLSVLGFFFENTSEEENLFIKNWNVSNNLGQTFKLNFEEIQKEIDSKHLNDYYAYLGSLTTPNCNEVVNWFVFKNPLNFSKAQKDLFNGYFKNNSKFAKGNGNNRLPQPLNGRTITSGSLDCSFSYIFIISYLLSLFYLF
jgi:carbonic anhydrase